LSHRAGQPRRNSTAAAMAAAAAAASQVGQHHLQVHILGVGGRLSPLSVLDDLV